MSNKSFPSVFNNRVFRADPDFHFFLYFSPLLTSTSFILLYYGLTYIPYMSNYP